MCVKQEEEEKMKREAEWKVKIVKWNFSKKRNYILIDIHGLNRDASY